MCTAIFVYLPPPPPTPPISEDVLISDLIMKSDADRRKTFEKWPVIFIDKNRLAVAGFYYTKLSNVVCFEFCEVQVGHREGDDPFKDHQRWSQTCGFIKDLFVGNIPIGSTDQPTTSPEHPTQNYDVCGPHFGL